MGCRLPCLSLVEERGHAIAAHADAFGLAAVHACRLLVAPILVLACLFGPCGLGLYFLVRSPFPEHYTAKAKAH